MHCPICESLKIKIFLKQQHLNTQVQIESRDLMVCESCGHCFAEIPEGPARVANWYEDTVYSTDVFSLDGSIPHPGIATEIVKKFPDRCVVDLGSGDGTLLKSLLSHESVSADQIMGIDFNTVDLKKFGIPNVELDLNDPNFDNLQGKKFDILTCMHVLEHLLDPVKTFVSAADTLTHENSFCYVEVPNHFAEPSDLFDFLSNGIPYGIQHIQFFSAASITLLLQKSGFNTILELTTDVSFGNISRLKVWAKRSETTDKTIRYHHAEAKRNGELFRKLMTEKIAQADDEVLIWGVGSTLRLMLDQAGCLTKLPNVRLVDANSAIQTFHDKKILRPKDLCADDIDNSIVFITPESRVSQIAILESITALGRPKDIFSWYDVKIY